MAQTTLIFGDSGAWKTTQIGFASLYLYERTGGKIVRAIYSDKGGWKPIQSYVDAGIIEPYFIDGEPDMPALLHKLARGYWPEVLENGIRPPGTKLLKPIGTTWSKVGGYAWEGLTSTSELLMKYLRDKQIPIAGDPVGKFEVVTQDENGKPERFLFCSNNMKHYDWVQKEVLALIGEFMALPVERVLISAHEAEGTDESDGRKAIRGPALVGKAGTSAVARNVGDCIHAEIFNTMVPVAKGEMGKIKSSVRYYFMSHPDPATPNVTYKCKPRVEAGMIPELMKIYPEGYFEPTTSEGLDKYLRTVDSLGQSDLVRLRKAEIDAKLLKKESSKAA